TAAIAVEEGHGMSEAFRITPVHDLLLRGTDEVPVGIYHLHLATAEQLCRLHYSPGSIKVIKARLKALTDHGYLMADVIPSKEVRKPYYYTLSPKGLRYLEHLGIDTHTSWRAPRELDRHGLFIQHTLETNDVLIPAALLHQADARYRLHGFVHERVLRRRPFQVQDTELAPDAFL